MMLAWPQLTWIALAALGVGWSIAKHGERRGPDSMWDSILGAGISASLLWAGGFFG